MSHQPIDTFLADCVKACLAGAALPPWPFAVADDAGERAAERIKFHGIALLLAQGAHALAGWPASTVAAVRDEARAQALWEASHRSAIIRLVSAFRAAGITAAAMKGTALAYGLYDDPAFRRRGDTDLYLPGASRSLARKVLRHCGFAPAGDRRPTQEPWSITAHDIFVHEVDIHWRLNDSLAVSRALDKLRCETRFAALPRLAPDTIALSGIDNMILTCVNRALHRTFGYFVEHDRVADGDRLIWAVDIKLVTDRFADADWTMLAQLAAASGTTRLVHSGLAFADGALGLALPRGLIESLAGQDGKDSVEDYVTTRSGMGRFLRDFAAATSPGELRDLAMLQLWPGEGAMTRWYPDAGEHPLWALRLRRLGVLGLRQLGLHS